MINTRNARKIEFAKISLSLSEPNKAGKESSPGAKIKIDVNLFVSLGDHRWYAINARRTAKPIHFDQVLIDNTCKPEENSIL